ncbi:MAG TPA: PspC domain-containing protein [Streptosporangiaceae bacterium]|jgi:phage shock protein PspC (stress-responsive transcriptional regulator)
MNSGTGTKVLVRKRNGRMVAGVCAGLADYVGTDVTLLRVIVAAVAVITGGAGILAYLIAWAIIPEEDQKSPAAENVTDRTREGSIR